MGIKPQPLSQIKKELNLQDRDSLINLCLELARFKRDNKEMLSYLLFDRQDEESYISALQAHMDAQNFAHLRADPHVRRQRGQRILEDHRHLAPADAVELLR